MPRYHCKASQLKGFRQPERLKDVKPTRPQFFDFLPRRKVCNTSDEGNKNHWRSWESCMKQKTAHSIAGCFTDLRAMTLCLSFVPLYKAEMSKTGIDCAKACADEFQCKKNVACMVRNWYESTVLEVWSSWPINVSFITILSWFFVFLIPVNCMSGLCWHHFFNAFDVGRFSQLCLLALHSVQTCCRIGFRPFKVLLVASKVVCVLHLWCKKHKKHWCLVPIASFPSSWA